MSVLAGRPKLDRIKRDLVRQAVEQNLELIHGRYTLRSQKRRRRWSQLLRWALPVLALPLAVALAYSAPWPRHEASGPASVPAESPRLASLEPRAATLSAAQPAPLSVPATTLPESVPAVLFPLAVRHVVVDAGHGGESLGTHLPGGLTEKEITLDVGLRLAERLESAGYKVTLTRDRDRFVSLKERAEIANAAGADIFVSIHVNWLADGGSRGVETYFLGPTNDPHLTRLAAEENRDSGYSLKDLRQLLDRIYGTVRQDKSAELAQALQISLYHSLRLVASDLTNRGVKTAPFVVLVDTEMPAVLAEVSCLSNSKEVELLAKPLYRQYIADALSLGIVAYARESAGNGT
ncbi:MAG: N-acetylmuramoyl-L-alanine amidase [Thermoanaerobaculia bacterium]